MSLSEHKTFFTIIVFLGVFGVLVSMIPPQFVTGPYSQNIFYGVVPAQFKIGSEEFSSSTYGNMTRDGLWHQLKLSYKAPDDTTISYNWHPAGFLVVEGIWYQHGGPPPLPAHLLEPYPVTKTFVMSNLKADNLSSFLLTDPNKDIPPITVIFTTAIGYTTLSASYDAGYMQYLLGFAANVTTQQVSYDVWQVVGQLMTFQSPDIHPALNAIVALPVWAAIIIAILYVLDKILPF